MNSDIKALIFDLDGTLADTIPAITEAVNMTLSQLGYPLRTESEITTFIGRGPRYLIEKSLPDSIVKIDIVDEALKIYDLKYADTYIHTERLYDGIENAIKILSNQYEIAVLSNKQDEYVKALIKQLLPTGFCKIARGSIKGTPAKPNPQAAIEVIDFLGYKPSECIIIGDSEIDIITAKNSGISSLSVSWGYTDKQKLIDSGAIDIIDSPDELIKYFT